MKKINILILLILIGSIAFAQKENTKQKTNPTNTKKEPPPPPFVTKMIYVEGGTFTMGSNEGDLDERPPHKVTVSSFYLSRYEITNEEYCRFLNEKKGNQTDGGVPWILLEGKEEGEFCRIYESKKKFYVEEGYEKFPVNFVTWYGAKAFCIWAGGRLPSEAEWEFAAKGGNKSNNFKYAGASLAEDAGWFYDNSAQKIHKIGLMSINELGFNDMSGNVKEWVEDWFSFKYSESDVTQVNPVYPVNTGYKVLRGGAFRDDERYLRCSNRHHETPVTYSVMNGFRLAKTKLNN